MLLVSEYNNMSVRTNDYFLSAFINESRFSVMRMPEQIISDLCYSWVVVHFKNIAEETINNL